MRVARVSGMSTAINGFENDLRMGCGKPHDCLRIVRDQCCRNTDAELMHGAELDGFLFVKLIRLPGIHPAGGAGFHKSPQRTEGIIEGDVLLICILERHRANARKIPPENAMDISQCQLARCGQMQRTLLTIGFPRHAEVCGELMCIKIIDDSSHLGQSGCEMRCMRVYS